MAICALGYLGVKSNQTDEWSRFASNLLGFQQVDNGGNTVAFRMDDYKQRFVVTDESGDSLAFIGWEVEHADDLTTYASDLDNAGYAVELGSRALCDQRCVAQLIAFNDPDGNRVELFHDPLISTDPFEPGRPITGFVTGPVGMGHAVLHVKDAQSLVPFYRNILGFALSDFGMKPVPLYFFHVNERHHSFAIVGSGRTGFHHFMVEYQNLDDVGQGYDLAQLEQDRIAYTLGRHTNDYMTSFYANTPSGFFVESGWGGRQIDPETWVAHETTVGPSFWGHERLHMHEDARARFREMRLKLARDGMQTPPISDCPWLFNELWRS
ncbi:MAG: VOC family protein [Gammaproteobacteria bacterium]|nr:VOC family protein [Gammaproteobacteria bacterium]